MWWIWLFLHFTIAICGHGMKGSFMRRQYFDVEGIIIMVNNNDSMSGETKHDIRFFVGFLLIVIRTPVRFRALCVTRILDYLCR